MLPTPFRVARDRRCHGHPGSDPGTDVHRLSDAYECWCAAYAREADSPWQTQPTHACDSSCPLFRHDDVYICCWSGYAHICTHDECDHLAVGDEHQACTLTGIAYALDYQATYEQGARLTKRLPSSIVPQKPRKPISDAGDEGDEGEIGATIRRMLDYRTLSTSIIGEVCTSWRRVKQTRLFHAKLERGWVAYDVEAHCLAHIYTAGRGGERFRGCDFVTHDTQLEDVDLHVRPDLLRKRRKILLRFKSLMYEWVERFYQQ